MPEDTAQKTPVRRALTLDVEKYQRMLNAPDMTGDKKAEIIEALWSLVVSFIDLGFDVLPLESCGQENDQPKTEDRKAVSMLPSNDTPTRQVFALAASTIDKEAS